MANYALIHQVSETDELYYLFLRWKIIFYLDQEEYDTHDPKGHQSVVLPFLMKRTKVVEIVAAQNIVFALNHSGVCAAFSRGRYIILLLESEVPKYFLFR